MKYKCFPQSEGNARECDQGPVSQCPHQSSVSSVLVRAHSAHSCDALWEIITPGPGQDYSPEEISMKPMSNMIVLALVVIWKYIVSIKMPPKNNFYFQQEWFCVWTKLFLPQTGVIVRLSLTNQSPMSESKIWVRVPDPNFWTEVVPVSQKSYGPSPHSLQGSESSQVPWGVMRCPKYWDHCIWRLYRL